VLRGIAIIFPVAVVTLAYVAAGCAMKWTPLGSFGNVALLISAFRVIHELSFHADRVLHRRVKSHLTVTHPVFTRGIIDALVQLIGVCGSSIGFDNLHRHPVSKEIILFANPLQLTFPVASRRLTVDIP